MTASMFAGGLLIMIGPNAALGNETPAPESSAESSAEAQPKNPYSYDPSGNPAEADLCKAKLADIGTAITNYRREHKDLPGWLSDLVPEFLPEEALICPVTERTERLSPFGALDPNLRCSYLYEFAPTPITETVKNAFPGPMMTNREWKQQQMGVVGSGVPIVRCLLHKPALNLSFGGDIYESPLFWENNFLDVANMEDFHPQ